MDKIELERLLLETPKTIQVKELELIGLCQDQIKASRTKEEIEAHFKSEVAMNLSLKNPEQRKAALELQLRDHAGYHDQINILSNMDLLIKPVQIELELQKNMLRSYLAVAEMISK